MALDLILSPEVSAARNDKKPIVALESTIIAHGLPWPENLEVGNTLESAVRAGGAVPATIAVLDGKIHVGLAPTELERLAGGKSEFIKVGAADLGPLIAAGKCGATTVSATTRIASLAGIAVFATGGIGGVHRGDSMDVSSDLTVLAREPVAVVSAGCKAILDLPRTLEVMETLGVLVVGMRTNEFPAFYTRESGLMLEHRADSAVALAKIIRAHWEVQRAGVLVANPIPPEAALPKAEIDLAFGHALATAAAQGVTGKRVTPFLLTELSRVTHKKSLVANRALAMNNARVAAELAVELARG